MKNDSKDKWIYLIILSLIWGSSFILIKKGLIGLSPLHLGALRIVFTAIFLITIGINSLKGLSLTNWKWITISGIIGSFIPAFLFAIAETEIDSAVASVLNSLVPLNTLLIGIAIFKVSTTRKQALGIILGFIGTCVLILAGADLNPAQNYIFSLYILLATVLYAVNVNIIKRFLQEVKPLTIVKGNFIGIVFPALAILLFTGFFTDRTYANPDFNMSVIYVLILAFFGTALAKVMFTKLVQLSTPVFASSVSYIMPIVALMWGLIDGEKFGALQGISSAIILTGVYITNKKA